MGKRNENGFYVLHYFMGELFAKPCLQKCRKDSQVTGKDSVPLRQKSPFRFLNNCVIKKAGKIKKNEIYVFTAIQSVSGTALL
jgi:hypothetical protein